jgi:hypothetical protein
MGIQLQHIFVWNVFHVELERCSRNDDEERETGVDERDLGRTGADER